MFKKVNSNITITNISKTIIFLFSFIFFFNDTATTEIYTLSLHDALPILQAQYSYYNAEFTRYGNAQEKFNNSYLAFTAGWIREHLPKQAASLKY